MGSLIDILTYVAPPVLLLLLGVAVRRVGWFRAEADASLSVLTVRVLYPCFFFFHIVGFQVSELKLKYVARSPYCDDL